MKRPTVVKLRNNTESIDTGSSNIAEIENGSGLSSSIYDYRPFKNNLNDDPSQLTIQDDEMKNDFKWLINYDLKTLSLHDIEGQDAPISAKRKMIAEETEQPLVFEVNRNDILTTLKSASILPKKRGLRSYTEMIESCLAEVGEATVKYIYKWIAERFPCFEAHDTAWKNAIRHALTVSPVFKKRNTKKGNCHLWYMENGQTINKTEKTDILDEKLDMEIETTHLPNLLMEPANAFAQDPSSPIVEIREVEEASILYSAIEYLQQNDGSCEISFCQTDWQDTEALHMAENTTNVKQPSVYCYELQTPMSTDYLTDRNNYTEPLEVKRLLDENAASIPVEKI